MPCVNLKKKIRGGPTLPTLYTKAPSKSYKFSESHGVYVKDPKQIPYTLPPPRAPQKTKAETIDVSEYLLVDDRAIRVPLTILNKPLDALVEYLVHDYDDEMSRVRVLYRWLTNQPIHRMKVLDQEPKSGDSALHHLWELKSQKKRYSVLFSLLCRYAGLYCVTIHGVVKGVNYDIGDRVDEDKHYGEWNAVFVDNEWRLVDSLWGACDVTDHGDGRGRFSCDEHFFLTDPKDLIYTHFALSDRWQLLDSPRHVESFEASVFLKNRFFELGMQVLSHPLCEIEADGGEVEIIFGLQPKQCHYQRFNGFISHFDRPDTKRYLSRGSNFSVPLFIHNVTESSVSVKVRFPEPGIFRMEIVGKVLDPTSPYKDYDWIAVYKVIAEVKSERGFPKMDPICWGPGKEVSRIGLAPFNYTSGLIVAKNAQIKIRFKILDTAQVQNMKFYFKLASTYDNDYSVNTVSDKFDIDLNIMTFYVEAPAFGEYTLKMYARNVRGNVSQSERKETNICNYLLISDIQLRESPLGILTEKTEYIDDPPEPSPRKRSAATSRKEETSADSVVSTSKVIMEPNSYVMERFMKDTANLQQGEPTTPRSGEESKHTGMLATKPPSPEASPPKKDQTDLQSESKQRIPSENKTANLEFNEIPEIPNNVVQPVEKSRSFVRNSEPKPEMKVVSTNKVVPLATAGGDDDSIMLVPDSKKTRPQSSVKRTRSRDDTKFFTALAHVRGDGK